jgi:hypothetical protein
MATPQGATDLLRVFDAEGREHFVNLALVADVMYVAEPGDQGPRPTAHVTLATAPPARYEIILHDQEAELFRDELAWRAGVQSTPLAPQTASEAGLEAVTDTPATTDDVRVRRWSAT